MQAPISILHVVHDLSQAPGYDALKGRKKQLRRMEDIAADMAHRITSYNVCYTKLLRNSNRDRDLFL